MIGPFVLIPALNTASWAAWPLGKTRSTVSATYMCSHVVTICLVVPEVSSSYHKKHCHIKHPADTETTVRDWALLAAEPSGYGLKMYQHRTSKWQSFSSSAFSQLQASHEWWNCCSSHWISLLNNCNYTILQVCKCLLLHVFAKYVERIKKNNWNKGYSPYQNKVLFLHSVKCLMVQWVKQD